MKLPQWEDIENRVRDYNEKHKSEDLGRWKDNLINSLRRENEDMKAKLDKAKDALRDVEQQTNITALALVNGFEAGTIFLSDKLFNVRQRARTTLEELGE